MEMCGCKPHIQPLESLRNTKGEKHSPLALLWGSSIYTCMFSRDAKKAETN